MTEWVEIRASGPEKTKEFAVLCFIEGGSNGVEVLGGDNPSKVSLRGHLPVEGVEEGSRASASLREALKVIGWSAEACNLPDTDWTERWKDFIKPSRVAPFVVGPWWSKLKVGTGDIEIRIDPGMAFGTGQHESTQLCLKAMGGLLSKGGKEGKGDKADSKRKRKVKVESLLDVGTGSGVLAIGGAKWGIPTVVGTDNDSEALKVAKKNGRLNGVDLKIRGTDISRVRGTFDLVVANILSHVLIEIKDSLARRVAPGGHLILLGILGSEAKEVIDAFEAVNIKGLRTLKLEKRYKKNEWVSLVFKELPINEVKAGGAIRQSAWGGA